MAAQLTGELCHGKHPDVKLPGIVHLADQHVLQQVCTVYSLQVIFMI